MPAEVISDLAELHGRRFGCIYADPPWRYENQSTRGATDDHYETMTVEEIASLPIGELAADRSHLHLWATEAFLADAITILGRWGFTRKGCFVWAKPQIGMGNYWRVSHEYLLLGVRGSLPFLAHDERSWQELPRGAHSAKPERIRVMLERVSPGPYLELFARRTSPGWVHWGNEVQRSLYDAV